MFTKNPFMVNHLIIYYYSMFTQYPGLDIHIHAV
jgi:hypothetical protein